MAIRLIDRYPNRANPASTDYPHGSGRNKSSPTAIDGTPFDENRYNDHEGFFQSLLEAAEVAPNNTPDTVPSSQYADALSIVANGLIEIDVGGSTDAVLDYNQARVHGFRLTGALTGNIDVVVPDTERMYTVVNDTTGDFTVTVKTALGTGVVVSQGQTFVVRCDGVDVVRGVDSQRTLYVESVAELVAASVPLDGTHYQTTSYHPGWAAAGVPAAGGGKYVWDAAQDKADHNGGTIIDPSKPFPADWSVRADVENWFTATNIGTGCFVSLDFDRIDATRFGAKPNFVLDEDASLPINKAIEVHNRVYIPAGNFATLRPIQTTKSGTIIQGAARGRTLITAVGGAGWDTTTIAGSVYDAVIVAADLDGVNWIEGGIMENFTVIANGSLGGRNGIQFKQVCNSQTLHEIEIRNANDGVFTANCWVHNYSNLYILSCHNAGLNLTAAANGFSMVGVEIYGRDQRTTYGLRMANACYGNTFTGGVLERLQVGFSIRNDAQIHLAGNDLESCTTLFGEFIDCDNVPSMLVSNTFVGVPSQAAFSVSNSRITVNGNSFPTTGQTSTDILYNPTNGSRIESNNNDFGGYINFESGNSLNVSGTDFGRVSFFENNRSAEPYILDEYLEDTLDLILRTSTLDLYTSASDLNRTAIGNAVTVEGNFIINGTLPTGGDYVIIYNDLNVAANSRYLGDFTLSPTSDGLFKDGIRGTIHNSGGKWYLMRNDTGDFLKKSAMIENQDNLFAIKLSYIDNV